MSSDAHAQTARASHSDPVYMIEVYGRSYQRISGHRAAEYNEAHGFSQHSELHTQENRHAADKSGGVSGMILLNSQAKTLRVDDLEWTRLLDAGRESGWNPHGARPTMALPGSNLVEVADCCSCGQQISTDDARHLARALRRDPEGLAVRLHVTGERLEQMLSFLEGGGFVLTSDLFALSQTLGWHSI